MPDTLTGILAAVVLGGTIAAMALPSVLARRTVAGQARVVDGDSLVVEGRRVRLYGIDAPELHQTCGASPCGIAAKATLERLIGDAPVTCVERDRDRYGRSVAQCHSVGGTELGGMLVALGQAVAYRRYSSEYVDQENAARSERLGIWATGFVNPEDWRHGRR